MLERPLNTNDTEADCPPLELDLIDSVALQRLIDEVRCDPTHIVGATAYNRTYHRHNR
ncbi:hypothetical protein HL653_21590 [Sphingomonas sp. AP4-R1]|uniref:YhhA family cyclophane-containing RiPP n=1 Tax=Sphingomonas sp. AP4-R1 TaxID=2735134 RepID=UPI001493AAC9|nr:YhhA family cyclophane-containing RiPP [Sphingomonas sp. AP4-R1]QJU59989.1 hypothetical protein HL653_21590 [Sphingomonas sp. AP4-R1]